MFLAQAKNELLGLTRARHCWEVLIKLNGLIDLLVTSPKPGCEPGLDSAIIATIGFIAS